MGPIPEKDLEIQVYTSNTDLELIPYRAIMITHIPTGERVVHVLNRYQSLTEAKTIAMSQLEAKVDTLPILDVP